MRNWNAPIINSANRRMPVQPLGGSGATSGVWFSYDMKVNPGQPVSLVVKYLGGDVGNRVFDILMDHKKTPPRD